MSGQKIGYIRVSSTEQNPERQLEGIDLDIKYTDTSSGKDTSRPQLNAMLNYARNGDTIIVHSMDRLARNLQDLRNLVDYLIKKKVKIDFLKEGLSFNGEDSPAAMLMLSVMGAFAEFERNLIKERQMEGIALAKKKGLYKGRKTALSQEQIQEVRRLASAGHQKTKIARDFSISRQTLYQYLKIK